MNPIKGEVRLTLAGGRDLTLVMDMEALVQAEGAYGKPMVQMTADAAAGFVGAVRALLFGALQFRHPDVTLREASRMFSTDRAAVIDALDKASECAFPDAKPAEDKGGPNPPGKRSGRSGVKPG